MCGRYVTVSTVQTIESRFQVQAAPDVSAQWRPNANVSHGEAAPVIASDIALGNHYTSTSPASHFTRNRVASLPQPRGRVSLLDFTITEIEDGNKGSRGIEAGPPYLDALMEYFGIRLDADYKDLRPLSEVVSANSV